MAKFPYDFADPKRWDVVVFRFPGNGQMNYIKRLVGLPHETVRIDQGDIYVKTADDEQFDDRPQAGGQSLGHGPSGLRQ